MYLSTLPFPELALDFNFDKNPAIIDKLGNIRKEVGFGGATRLNVAGI